tara:strand:+ start:276 stop:764 length:489 start_codon:yes stop_codon:yes gene_type:complete
MEDQKAIDKLQKQIEGLEKEKGEYLAGWQRAKADLANYKKEEKERMHGLMEYVKCEFLFFFLSLLDNLERAERELKEEEKNSKVVQGFLQIGKQLREFLKSQGVKEIDVQGKDFNPVLHEAIATVQGLPGQGEKSGKVVEVLEKGYMIQDKLLRPAKVKVVK